MSLCPARVGTLALLLALAVPASGLASGPSPVRLGLGAAQRTAPLLPPPPPRIQSDPHAAAQAGVDWLMGQLCSWMDTTGQAVDCSDGATKTCFGCHVQAETVLGLTRSAQRCYTLQATTCAGPTDESPIEFATRFIAEAQRKDCIIGPRTSCGTALDPTTTDGWPAELGSIGHYGKCGSNASPASVHPVIQSAHGGLNLAGYTRYVSPRYATNLVALADWFVRKQDATGKWVPDRNEAPVDQGEPFVTGAASTVLRTAEPYATPAQVASYEAALARAVDWTAANSPVTTQDKAFSLLTLLEGAVPAGDIRLRRIMNDLLSDQAADGGFPERFGLEDNAYATGQAVYALIEAGLALNDPSICAGVRWLVDHQAPDGSWAIGTAGISTDSTRNSDFTATIWPVLALGSFSPWGAAIEPSSDALTCKSKFAWSVMVTHAADTACGAFSQPDTYDLSVTNDLGDVVEVVPDRVSLAAGESAAVTVSWQRVTPVPPGGISTNTLVVSSEGARTAGCPVDARTDLRVIRADDPVPDAVGASLRVARPGSDVEVTWDRIGTDIGGYELVASTCPLRSSCVDHPDPARLDGMAALASTPLDVLRVTLAGQALPGMPGLEFYKVRAVSPCFLAPGRTCDSGCGGPGQCLDACP